MASHGFSHPIGLVTLLLASCGCSKEVPTPPPQRSSTTQVHAASSATSAGAASSATAIPVRGECTERFCLDDLAIEVRSPIEQPGVYALTLGLDGKTTTCDIAVTRAKPPQVTTRRSVCGQLSTSRKSPQLSELHFAGRPSRLSLQLQRDGQTLASGSYRPHYTEARPNGPGCAPVCLTAGVQLLTGAGGKDPLKRSGGLL